MRRISIMVSLLGVAGGGCAKQSNAGLTVDQAKAAGDALGSGIENASVTFGPVATTAADASCVTLAGDTTDPDGDTIPSAATLTYACTTQAFGFTGMLTGTQAVTDDQPATRAWAFTGDADLHASLTGPGGGSITSDWSGRIVGSQTTALGPFGLHRALDVTTVFTRGGAAATSTTVSETNAWDVTFTPQATWSPGGVIVTGELGATGSWDVTVDGVSFAATLATPTPLTITPSCKTLVTAGVATGTYPREGGGTGSITVTWTGCGVHTVTHAE